jgi:hypothetical protein
MTTQAKIGPSLVEVYPPFAEKLRQYNRLLKRNPERAEAIFAEAQIIAHAFRAGAEYAGRK